MAEQLFHVGVKGLIRRADGKILLLQVNPKLKAEGQPIYWDFPGGRIQQGQNWLEALTSEIADETGLTVTGTPRLLAPAFSNLPREIDGHSITFLMIVYEVTVKDTSQVKISNEHTEFEWVDMAEAPNRLSDKYPKEFVELLSFEGR